MNISQALNAAADHIEQNPSSYRFNNATVPRDGEQGCMLGHLGRVAGLPVGLPVETLALTVLGQPASDFYEEISRDAQGTIHGDLVHYAHLVAPAMRGVAKKYEGIPQDVRDIFNAKAAGVPYPVLSAPFYMHFATLTARRQIEAQISAVMGVAS
jgi:hypothetical protein